MAANTPVGREFPSLSFSITANEDGAPKPGPVLAVSSPLSCFPASPSELPSSSSSEGAQSIDSEGTKLNFDEEQQPKRGSLTAKLLPPIKIDRAHSSPPTTTTSDAPRPSLSESFPEDGGSQSKRGSLKRVAEEAGCEMALSISITESTPLSLRLPQDDLPANSSSNVVVLFFFFLSTDNTSTRRSCPLFVGC